MKPFDLPLLVGCFRFPFSELGLNYFLNSLSWCTSGRTKNHPNLHKLFIILNIFIGVSIKEIFLGVNR